MSNISINYEVISENIRNILIEQNSDFMNYSNNYKSSYKEKSTPSYLRGVLGGAAISTLVGGGLIHANNKFQAKREAAKEAVYQLETAKRAKKIADELKKADLLKKQELANIEAQRKLVAPEEVKTIVKNVLEKKKLPPEISSVEVQSKLNKALTSLGIASKEFVSYLADQIILHPKIALSLAGIASLYAIWKRSQHNKF